MGNNSLFDGDDSDIIVDSSYFGAADTTGDGKIVINSSYFGADGAIDPEDDVHLESAEFNEETRELVLTLNDGENITTVIAGGGAAGAAHVIGFLPPGHEDHSGGENDGEIILGDSENNIISALPVDVRALSAIIPDDNGLIGTDNARLVFNVSTHGPSRR